MRLSRPRLTITASWSASTWIPGQPLAAKPIRAEPGGIFPVHHPDGWVGLSEGEGQEAAQA